MPPNSFGHFLLELFQTARRFDMEVQPQLVLLQKTLLNIEGVGRQLYPELDLWETAKPFMERWMAQRAGPVAALREVADRAPEFLEQLPQVPGLVLEATRQLQRLDDIANAQHKTMATLDAMLAERVRSERRRRLTGMGALILGAGLFLPAAASAVMPFFILFSRFLSS